MIISAGKLAEKIDKGEVDNSFTTLYRRPNIAAEKRRYCRLLEFLARDIPAAKAMMVTSPGRTELGGNHTDHNHGCVLAGAVDLDCVAAVTPVDIPEITMFSEEYSKPVRVDLTNLQPHREEEGSGEALVRGVAAAIYRITGKRGGFYGRVHSTCRPGKGFSSSAAFSVMVGGILNFLYCDQQLTQLELASIAHEAENAYFGKPCGMMDQIASACGGTIFIDFKNPTKPLINRIVHKLAGSGYCLAIIDTGTSHAELTDEYGAIRQEIKEAAEVFNQEFARGITMKMALSSISEIRQRAGDRAVLRLIHFIEENHRAKHMAKCLEDGQFTTFMKLVEASGMSSCNLLQNCAVPTVSHDQGILLALAAAKRICPRGVYRVHGGGFGGTIQAYVPEKEFDDFFLFMEELFGNGSVTTVQLGRPGVCGLGDKGLISTPIH